MKRKDLYILGGILFLLVLGIFTGGRGPGLVRKFIPHKNIGVVRIQGVIASSEGIVKWIENLMHNKEVAGILLLINSPGGSAAASEEIYRALVRYKDSTHKPIVAYISQVGASGGYYVACAADKIVINPEAITGSIGVILEFPQYSGLMEKLGLKIHVIKSGKFKDIGSPFREPTEEEQKILQHLIDEAYQRFVEVVSQGRDLPRDSVLHLANGVIYTAKDAIKYGLCDTIGDRYTAINLLKQMAKIKKIHEFVEQKKRFSLRDLLKLQENLYKPLGMIISYRMVP